MNNCILVKTSNDKNIMLALFTGLPITPIINHTNGTHITSTTMLVGCLAVSWNQLMIIYTGSYTRN